MTPADMHGNGDQDLSGHRLCSRLRRGRCPTRRIAGTSHLSGQREARPRHAAWAARGVSRETTAKTFQDTWRPRPTDSSVPTHCAYCCPAGVQGGLTPQPNDEVHTHGRGLNRPDLPLTRVRAGSPGSPAATNAIEAAQWTRHLRGDLVHGRLVAHAAYENRRRCPT